MRVKVTEQGLVIPQELLEGIQEVESCREDEHIVLIPILESDLNSKSETGSPSGITKGTLTGLRGIAKLSETPPSDAREN